jgi:phosphopantetheinyl transferase
MMEYNHVNHNLSFGLSSSLIWPPTVPGCQLTFIRDDPALEQSLLAGFLSARETAFIQSRTAPAARRQCLLGRLAAKAAAGRRWNLPWEEIEILPGPSGEPLAIKIDGETRVGHVSISHTSGAAAAAAAGEPVGLDIEPRFRHLGDRAWEWAFKTEERGLAEEGADYYPTRLALWCAREAAAKSWGRGLLNHLNQVQVTRADWPAGRLWVTWQGRKARICETSLLLQEEYLVALTRKNFYI